MLDDGSVGVLIAVAKDACKVLTNKVSAVGPGSISHQAASATRHVSLEMTSNASSALDEQRGVSSSSFCHKARIIEDAKQCQLST